MLFKTSRTRVMVYAYGAVILCMLLWGSSFPIARKLLLLHLLPIELSFIRFAFVSILLAPWVIRKLWVYRFSAKQWGSLLGMSLSGTSFYMWAQYQGLTLVPSGYAAMIIALIPIFTALLAWGILKEPLTMIQWLGTVLSFSGALLVITEGKLHVSGLTLQGTFFLLINCLLWPLYTIINRKVKDDFNLWFLIGVISWIGTLSLLPFLDFTSLISRVKTFSGEEWGWIFYVALVCSLLCYLLWSYTLKFLSAALTANFLFIEPIVAYALGWLMLGEKRIMPLTVLGACLVFLGIFLVHRNGATPASSPETIIEKSHSLGRNMPKN